MCALVIVSKFTLKEASLGAQCTFGQASKLGASNTATPPPSNSKCTCRVAAQLGIIATGREAACVG